MSTVSSMVQPNEWQHQYYSRIWKLMNLRHNWESAFKKLTFPNLQAWGNNTIALGRNYIKM